MTPKQRAAFEPIVEQLKARHASLALSYVHLIGEHKGRIMDPDVAEECAELEAFFRAFKIEHDTTEALCAAEIEIFDGKRPRC